VRIWPRCWIGPNLVVERDITEEGRFVRLGQEVLVGEVPAEERGR